MPISTSSLTFKSCPQFCISFIEVPLKTEHFGPSKPPLTIHPFEFNSNGFELGLGYRSVQKCSVFRGTSIKEIQNCGQDLKVKLEVEIGMRIIFARVLW